MAGRRWRKEGALNREQLATADGAATLRRDRPEVGSADILLDHVTKRFGAVTAVDDLLLEVKRGEFFSLLGPSGCGKTTTLRMIGGFEDPTDGKVHLGGTDVTAIPPYHRDVNTVFQSYALFPHLTVFENVAFGLKRRGVGKGEIRQRVREMLALVDLPLFEKRKPNQLSGGQQQRVALARALVNRPRVLLLDEPMGALDAKLRKQMQLELKRIQRDVGITFLYVTHDQEEAMSMSDRLAVMRGGRAEDVGPPSRVYDQPATEFVASFLGASNLIDARVTQIDPDVAQLATADGLRLFVARERLGIFTTSDHVKVGIRPEKVRLAPRDDEPSGPVNDVVTVVETATFTGVSSQYTLAGPSRHEFTVYAQNTGQARALTPGEEIRLQWRPEDAFIVPLSPQEAQDDGDQT
jgi:spermidine/putrescine transport system ATP-binding protein